jgi:predicted transcriptional regulator
VLYDAVLATNLQGLGDKKIKKLIAYKRTLLVATPADRALLILMRMKEQGVSAVPLIEARTGKILQEFSVMAVSAVHASNFGVLMGTAQSVLNAVDPYFAGAAVPIISRKTATLADIIELMWKGKRAHVWICDKDNIGQGVVSLDDIMKLLSDGVLAAENGKKVKKSQRFNKTKSMKHMKKL